MKLLQKATLQMAYLKAGIYAKAGAGKSYTATSIAIGLYKYAKLSKPVAWLDTETGSDFLLPRFKAEGIELFVAKTRSFQDLLAIIDEAEKGCSILIIDSITHPWNELVDSYLAKNELKRLRLKDWQPIKKTWREFTDRYLQSKLHIIVCGRSADEWQEIEDTEDGSLELKKVGTKMKTETEMGHEPSLLIEMEAIQLTSRTGSNYIHRAYVKKDRWDIINGKMFDDPKFEDFLPAIAPLNLGGEHKALEPGRNSTDMFEKGNTGEQRAITRDIFVEKIANEIKLLYPGQSEADKVGRLKLMNETFGTNSWVEIEKRVYMEKLEAGFSKLKALNKAGDPVSAEDEAKPKPKKGGTK